MSTVVDFQNWCIFILLCFFSLLCYSVFFRKVKELNLIPSPPSFPIIGHLHLLLSTLPHKSFQKISTKYGPLLHLRIFSFPIVLVSSPSMAYEIYRTHDLNVSSRTLAPDSESLIMGSDGFVSTPYGDYFKLIKKLVVTKLLRPQAIEQSRLIRATELQGLYTNLLDMAMKKESVEIGKEAMKLTVNMICRMNMGITRSEDADRFSELVIKSFALTKKIFFSNIFRKPLEKLGIALFRNEIMGVSRGFDELLEKILVEHEGKLEEHQDDGDLMDLFLEAYRDEKAEYKLTRHQIKSVFVETAGDFLAGTDTPVQAIQWTMAEMINHPEILKRLREEIDSVVGKTRLIQETDLPNLPYLQAVVKEGLRLHPPAALLVRTFQESCEIKGFYIPEKTTLVVNAYHVMRDPGSWQDPDEFRPERFLDSVRSEQEEEVREKAIKYLPFGSGRRGCLGENLAYIFLGTAVGMMVQGFDWTIKEKKVNMEEAVLGMVLAMAHPLKCTPVVRTLNPLTF